MLVKQGGYSTMQYIKSEYTPLQFHLNGKWFQIVWLLNNCNTFKLNFRVFPPMKDLKKKKKVRDWSLFQLAYTVGQNIGDSV